MNANFQLKVNRQIEQLQRQPLPAIESGIAQKRINWIRHNLPPERRERPSPRQAFEWLFFDNMGLAPEELPVVSETDTEIIWRSLNPCPTLEATRELGLDTRQVCRAINEKSTQAFLSELDPQLRFFRSYEEIRPYSDDCLERIVRVDLAESMRVALKEARTSRREGNQGYGAVVTWGCHIVVRAHDTVMTGSDPSLHAEVNAIQQAVEVLGDRNLSGAILFSACEPCPMCTALAVWANLTTNVYGVSMEEMACLGRSSILISAREIIARSPVMVELVGDVLKEECRALYI